MASAAYNSVASCFGGNGYACGKVIAGVAPLLVGAEFVEVSDAVELIDGADLLAEAANGIRAYEVGTYDALKARSLVGDGLDIHHVGQAHVMKQIVQGYSRATGPSIALPRSEHILIRNLKGATDLTPRQLLARDIWNLRNATEAPNDALQRLIELNKKMYPGAF